MYGKSNMETYIIIYKIDIQWEFAVWLRKLKKGLCINLEGWDRHADVEMTVARSFCSQIPRNGGHGMPCRATQEASG